MGTFAGNTLIDEVARRMRDTSNTAYPRATVLNILNRVQDAINVRLGLVHATATFATSNTALYSTSTIASNYAYPVQMFDAEGRELDLVPFDRLTQQDDRWLRLRGQRPEFFSPIGRELLAVGPVPFSASTLTLRYIKHPTALADAGAPLWDLPDEHKPLLLDLVEAVLLLRARDFRAIQESLNRAAPKLGLEDQAQIVRRGTVGERLKAGPVTGR